MIMNTFMLTIASPDGNKYSDQAQMLTAGGIDIRGGSPPVFLHARSLPSEPRVTRRTAAEKSRMATSRRSTVPRRL